MNDKAQEIRNQIAELQQQLESLKGPRVMALYALWNATTRALIEEDDKWLPQVVKDIPPQGFPRLGIIRKHFDMSETEQSNADKQALGIVAKA